MPLSEAQLQIIRNATKDDIAYQQVLQVIVDSQASPFNSLSHIFDSTFFTQLQVMLKSVPIPIYIKDLNGRYILANPQAVQLLGQTSIDDIKGKTDFCFYDNEVAQEQKKQDSQVFKMDTVIKSEIEIVHSEYHKWYQITKTAIYNDEGEIIGLIGIYTDISKAKQNQIRLAEERNLLQTIINHIQDKIYVKDREGRFLLANTATLDAHGTTLEELIGTTDFDYMEQEKAEQFFQDDQRVAESGISILNQEQEAPLSLTNNIKKWYLATKLPFRNEDGVVVGVIGVNRDITSIKLAELQRKQLALEQEKSIILSDFITASSHEFKTPISTIKTVIYLMKQHVSSKKIELYIDTVDIQAQRLTSLVESLLMMSRLDKNPQIDLRQVHLNDLISMIFTQIQAKSIDTDLHIELEMDSSINLIKADAKLLMIAIQEILYNAINYTADNDTIKILSYMKDGIPIIEIQDTGVGMTKDVIVQIFTRFYRADEAHSTKGFGLGLSIANKIVELHQGHIEVESQFNVGSNFRIILPQL